MIRRVFSSVLTYAIGTAGILVCFAYPIAEIIYPGTDAGKYILMISPLIPVMYLDTSTDAFLKGMGEQFYCMIVNIIDALLSVILVWILLPRMGIMGYIVTVYFTELLNAALSIARLLYVARVRIHWRSWLLFPLLSISTSTLSVIVMIRALNISVRSAPCMITQVLFCIGIYLLCISVLTKEKRKL
jgi:stage V sporulation protein B